MKKYLQLICMLLTGLLCTGVLAACSKEDASQTAKPDPATEFTITNEFVITVPANATEEELSAARSVQTALKAMDLTLPIQTDSQTAKHEIVIGKTSRVESTSAANELNAGDFTVAAMGSAEHGHKIALAASDDDGIALAAIYFNYTILKGDGAGKLSASFTFTYRRSAPTVGGNDLSTYSILYAKEGARADKNIEAAKYGDTVQIFADLLEKATGTAPTLVEDGGRFQPTGNLILFGDTTLQDDDSVYSNRYTPVGSYKVQLKGDKIVLGGHNPCSALAAGEAFVNSILNAQDGKIDQLSLKGEKNIIKVGCVGDSITYGTGSDDSSMQSYPVYLQRMLGYDYYVEKYGAPSNSLIETDDPTFLKNAYFEQSVNAHLDVVIIMLGTNDCRSQKWADSAHKDWRDPQRTTTFLASGQKLIDAYRGANKDIQIIWATCPTVPQDEWLGSDWTARLERYGNPCVKQLAEANGCGLIDIFTYSQNHLEMFEGSDGLHCKNEGYAILAQGFYELTKDLLP